MTFKVKAMSVTVYVYFMSGQKLNCLFHFSLSLSLLHTLTHTHTHFALVFAQVSHTQPQEITFRIHERFKVGALQPAAVSVYEYFDRESQRH